MPFSDQRKRREARRRDGGRGGAINYILRSQNNRNLIGEEDESREEHEGVSGCILLAVSGVSAVASVLTASGIIAISKPSGVIPPELFRRLDLLQISVVPLSGGKGGFCEWLLNHGCPAL